MRFFIFRLPTLALMLAVFSARAADRPLAVLFDARPLPQATLPPHTDWRWSPELKAKADTFSDKSVIALPEGNGNTLRIKVADDFPWGPNPERFFGLTNAHFPPESDAIVLRLRVLSGQFTLAVGGPTAYFGDSDVHTSPQRIEAGDWRDVRFDLHTGLCRNFRRAGYGRAAKAVVYTRWAQEPPALYLLPGSAGVLLLEQATLVTAGRGRPFPAFEPAALVSVQHVPTTPANAFRLLLADSQHADFEASWRDPKACRYPPPLLAATPGPSPELPEALSATCLWQEEIRWAGVKTRPTTNANAVVLTVRVHPATRATQAGSDAGQPVDLAILGIPANTEFPWERLAPDPAWRSAEGPHGYDVQFSNRVLAGMEGLHVAMYHARRFVKTTEWQTLVIPFEDMACIAATGSLLEHLVAHGPPAGVATAGVAWLISWPRDGRSTPVALDVADVRLVALPSGSASGRSYPRPLITDQRSIDISTPLQLTSPP